jgi:1-acyl-sn-glycerol-3-phosphate acyltransferase
MSRNPFIRLLHFLFFAVLVRAVILVVLGLTVRNRERLPKGGPALVVANHSSNLDVLALMSLISLKLLLKICPVVPVFMHGLGKALPKGSSLLVPFNCTASVGKPLYGTGTFNEFVAELEETMIELGEEESEPA